MQVSPQLGRGDDARNKYLAENIRYPNGSSEIQGVVIVNFVVEKDGSLTNIKILRSLSENFDKEALGVVEDMPKWDPGLQRGKPVRVYVNLPMRFTLK